MNNIYEIICKENQLALKNMHSQLDDIMRIYKQRNYDEYITAHIEILHNSFNVFSALFNNLSLTDIKYINEEIINEINYVRKEEEVHFRALISIFENNHIPNNFSALEEMGIPIQTLDKLVSEELKGYSVNDLSKYLITNLNTLSKLDDMDRLFIKRALLI